MSWLTVVFLSFVFLVSCQVGPTRIREQTVNLDLKNAVVIDTRSHLDYASFHFSGSVHLQSSDYLLLKPGPVPKRIFDPDLEQTIERLARRGIHPQKKIILVSDDKSDPAEAKKWRWLLRQLGVSEISAMPFSKLKDRLGGRPPQASPERMPVWTVADANKITKKAEDCFASWNDSLCN